MWVPQASRIERSDLQIDYYSLHGWRTGQREAEGCVYCLQHWDKMPCFWGGGEIPIPLLRGHFSVHSWATVLDGKFPCLPGWCQGGTLCSGEANHQLCLLFMVLLKQPSWIHKCSQSTPPTMLLLQHHRVCGRGYLIRGRGLVFV